MKLLTQHEQRNQQLKYIYCKKQNPSRRNYKFSPNNLQIIELIKGGIVCEKIMRIRSVKLSVTENHISVFHCQDLHSIKI